MNQQDGSKHANMMEDMRRAMNLALWIAFILAIPVQLWLRKGMGSRYPGYHVFLGIAFAFVFPAFIPTENPLGMLIFAVGSVMFLLIHWIDTAKAWREGRVIHSQYSGDSQFKGAKAKTVTEPFVVACLGLALLYVSPPLGVYLMLAAVGSGVFHASIEQRDLARRREVRDAMMQAEYEQQIMEEERRRIGR